MKKTTVHGPVTGLPRIALAFLLALLVVGCGDSSDDDPAAALPGSVTSANAPAVANETWTTTSVPIDVLAIYANPDLPLFSGLPFSATASPALTLPTGTVDCGPNPADGSLSYALIGTSLVVDFTDCIVAGVTLNGRFTISNITGDPSACPGTASFSVAFDNFKVSDALRTIVVNGGYDHTLSVSDNDANPGCETQHHSLAGTSLTFTVDGEAFVLSGFTIEKTFNSDTGAYSIEFAGTVSSNAAGGTVSARTTTPISGNSADTYPSGGVIEISDGTAIATMTINNSIPDDPNAVTVAYDADGDGTPEVTQNYSWDALKAM